MLQYVDDFTQLAIVNDMQMRFSEGIPLSMSYVQVLNDKIKRLNDSFKAMDVRWTTFVQAMQLEIAEDEELMNLMTRVQQVKQTVADSIAAKQQKCDALTDFAKAEELILGQDTVYAGLYKKAFELSLLQKLTPQLEKVKANEQTLFSQIQEHYGKAQKACEIMPMLSKRMEVLNDHYANVQVMSKKIQEMAYKPFIQRIKDYLIGLACVAILLLFINMMRTKYKTMKAARKQMKQYQEMMRMNGGAGADYPTI